MFPIAAATQLRQFSMGVPVRVGEPVDAAAKARDGVRIRQAGKELQ